MSVATTIRELEVCDLVIPLCTPFGIATGAQVTAENLLIRVRLENGVEGFGEAAPFPAVTGETQASTRAALERVSGELIGRDARAYRPLAAWLGKQLSSAASARCAVETAVLDAVARTARLPLWAWFGGTGSTLVTDMTITTGGVDDARAAAERIAEQGFFTIKAKVGGRPLAEDLARLGAILDAAPSLALLLDANGAMASVAEALQLLDAVCSRGGRVVLFEQPLGKHDLSGMAALTARSPVPIGADESCGSVADVVAIAQAKAAHVVNLKLMKSGVVEGWNMALVARAHGLGLMIGAMVESTLGLSMSACFAAGVGGFSHVDLDTHLWMSANPFRGGFAQHGPRLELGAIDAGHGVVPDVQRASRSKRGP